MKRVILLSVSILLISLAYSFAEVPCKINYQGRLIKNNVPVDGTKTMVFSIYNDAVAVTPPLWTSGDVDITVHNGLFRYVLDLSSIDDWTAGEALYLEVVIDGETLTPREELYAYPYAINSHLLEGEAKEYFLDTSGDAQTKQGNLNIMGNVGVGTTGPTRKLDIAGNARIVGGSADPALYVSGNKGITGKAAADIGVLGLGPGSGGYMARKTGIMGVQLGNSDFAGYFEGKVSVTGNVGIGTTSPGAKLDVQGGAIKATGGLIIETRTSDPASPATGQMWLRTD